MAVVTLLSEISSDSHGKVSPSIYETARLVTLAPWLTGHRRRVRFLLERQHPDGSWGGPDGYGLVPTLSATEALLASLRQWHDESGHVLGYGDIDYGDIVSAAERGLRALFGWLDADNRVLVPDTIAVEMVVPTLVAEVNAHLDQLAVEPMVGLDAWCGSARLVLPHGMDDRLLVRLRDAVRQGHALPAKLLHSLEVIGAPARGASFVHPVQGGVGCSPAATAAWLGDRPLSAGDHPSVGYLEVAQDRGGGPVPGVTPITVFERAWVLAALTAAGVSLAVPQELVGSLHTAFGEFGAPAAPGLPPDSDDTATALYALAQLGSPRSPDCLWAYQVDSYFSCFAAERTPSTSTNAHILQAFGTCLTQDLPQRSRYQGAISKLSEWLRDCQETEGSWWDKWHASPYYATTCCAVTLARYGGEASATAVRKAVEWVLGNQRADGSWGRWRGTYEETAYAVRTLLLMCASRADGTIERAAARGCTFLLRSSDDHEYPPLWHDKDLYTPFRVVRAEVQAALHLAQADPQVAAMIVHSGAEGSNARWRSEV